MRIMVKSSFPVEPFNDALRDGSAGAKLGRILEELKPEATYFTDDGGKRTAFMILDLADASRIPSIAEPLFLTFNATVDIHVVMTREDLARSGLDGMGKKYAP